MRQLKAPHSLADGAREGPLFMAEKLAFQQACGNRGAIQLHESIRFARAEIVHGASNQFLAGARLSIDQHSGVGRRDRLNFSQNKLQSMAGPDDVIEMKLAADFGFQIDVLSHKPVFELRYLSVSERVVDSESDLIGNLTEKGKILFSERTLSRAAKSQYSHGALTAQEREEATCM